jgi:putative intracellular protease/amidase
MRIVIPVFDRFTALDAVGPYEVLSRLPGAEVVFAAPVAGPVRTDTGSLAVVADVGLDQVSDCDVLVLPGGPGTRTRQDDARFLDRIRALDAMAEWTTSVCTGSLVLAAAGLLDGVEATTHWSAIDELESLGAVYRAERVVIRGKIITAAGVSAGIDMALTLAGLLAGDDVARAIQLAIEYDPQPPYDDGSLATASADIVALVRSVLASRGVTRPASTPVAGR